MKILNPAAILLCLGTFAAGISAATAANDICQDTAVRASFREIAKAADINHCELASVQKSRTLEVRAIWQVSISCNGLRSPESVEFFNFRVVTRTAFGGGRSRIPVCYVSSIDYLGHSN